MREVQVSSTPLERLATLLSPVRAERLGTSAARARAAFGDRTVWHVSATSHGGGVAEMLQTLLAYGKGAGIENRWLVIDGDPHFFRITKRVHNLLHGTPGDGGPLGEAEHAHYVRTLGTNLEEILRLTERGDIVLLHDPQTLGLAAGLRRAGLHVAWRCHVGRDDTNDLTDLVWGFLRPFLEHVEMLVFSRRAYAPAWVDPSRLAVIAPSIDPFSAKNLRLSRDLVTDVLLTSGLVAGGEPAGPVSFERRDGSRGTLRRHASSGDLLVEGPPPPRTAPIVLQVSRWDRLKDMAGVMSGFTGLAAEHRFEGVHLVLAGPAVSGVSDDPEGAAVLRACHRQWSELPADVRARIHLVSVPMDDVDENAVIVNALQRHARVVVQKSLVEGFGLTVTEAMWKAKPVIASAVGGIQDQITDGLDGLLVHDPGDLPAFTDALRRVLDDTRLASQLGEAAEARVRAEYLGDRHLAQYGELFADLVSAGPGG
jgi:trehalose synthase